MNSPERLTASQAVAQLTAGTLTAEALTRACLEQARAGAEIKAWAWLDPEQAIAQARAVDRAGRKGLLAGVPVGIKDIIDTVDMPTGHGSPIYPRHRPFADAACVALIRAASGVILGKTVTTEFANRHPGPTANPHNIDHTPGGSSSGSAAAVADFMVPLAIGTQTGGSVIRPAAFCGIVGLRPTPGLIPNHPMPLIWDPGQVHGALGRDAEDTAFMLDAMVGFSRLSPISVAPPWTSALAEMEQRADASKLRVAYAPDIAGLGVDAEIEGICRNAALGLRSAGAIVEVIDFDVADGRGPYQTWRGLWMVGQQYERLSEIERFGKNLRGNVEVGLTLTALDIAAAEQKRQQAYHRFRALFERFDILLTPAAPVKPFAVEVDFPDSINGHKLANYLDWIAPAFLVTLVSLPAASAPAGLTRDGLPVGMQIVAPRFEEPLILSVAKLIHGSSGVGWPPALQ